VRNGGYYTIRNLVIYTAPLTVFYMNESKKVRMGWTCDLDDDKKCIHNFGFKTYCCNFTTMHALFSRYLATFFAASKHNYDVHITTDILIKE
jgi:hypothetical protein